MTPGNHWSTCQTGSYMDAVLWPCSNTSEKSHLTRDAGSTCHSAMHPSKLAEINPRVLLLPSCATHTGLMLMMQFWWGPGLSVPFALAPAASLLPPVSLLLLRAPGSGAAAAAAAALLLLAATAAACCSNILMRADREEDLGAAEGCCGWLLAFMPAKSVGRKECRAGGRCR